MTSVGKQDVSELGRLQCALFLSPDFDELETDQYTRNIVSQT